MARRQRRCTGAHQIEVGEVETASSTRRLPVRATTADGLLPRTRSRAVSTVIAPIAAKAAAVASPMPELARFTTTVVPSSAEAAPVPLTRGDGARPPRARPIGWRRPCTRPHTVADSVPAQWMRPHEVSQGRAELAERARRERGAVAPTASSARPPTAARRSQAVWPARGPKKRARQPVTASLRWSGVTWDSSRHGCPRGRPRGCPGTPMVASCRR